MLAGALAVSATASAQESYAPAANDFSVEIQFNPFSNNFTTFQIDQLKAVTCSLTKTPSVSASVSGLTKTNSHPTRRCRRDMGKSQDRATSQSSLKYSSAGNVISLTTTCRPLCRCRNRLPLRLCRSYDTDLDSDDKEIKGSIVNCTNKDGSGDRTMHSSM